MIGSLSTVIHRHLGEGTPDLADPQVLLGVRGTLANFLMAVPHGIRSALFFFLLILILRALLRNMWLAGAVFALLWSAASMGNHPAVNVPISAAVFGLLALFMLRRGLLAVAVGLFVALLLETAPVTLQTQAWYFSSEVFMVGIIVVLVGWGFRTATAGRALWKADLMG